MNSKLLIALAALSLSVPAMATTAIGIVSCDSWLHPETDLEPIVNQRWVVGFASGMNVMNSTLTKGSPDELLRFTSTQQLISIVDDHCAANPLGNAADPVIALFAVFRQLAKPPK